VVAIWNPHAKVVEFFVLRGLPFGSAAAVLQFNRYPQFMAYFLAAFFGVCCASYYDDYDVAEPLYSVHFSQYLLWRLHAKCGFLLDKEKHVRASVQGNAFLGIITDFTSFCDGAIYMRISESRKTKVLAMLHNVLQTKTLTSAQASSLRGKLYFCMLTAFNKVGRGPLRAFTDRQYSRSRQLTPELKDAIEFFLGLLPRIMGPNLRVSKTIPQMRGLWVQAKLREARFAQMRSHREMAHPSN
jgi:hypothetical protein